MILTQDSENQTFIPIVFYGYSARSGANLVPFPQTTNHILDAVLDGKPAILGEWYDKPLLHGNHKNWFTNKQPGKCDKTRRGEYLTKNGAFGGCDEYPFFSSDEGGSLKYDQGGVSLRLVPQSESSPQGSLMEPNSRVKPAGVKPGDRDEKYYGVVPIPSLLISFWRKRDGGILF